MIQQIDNKLLSSFLLLIDHEILKRGQAYTNYSSQFYQTPSFIKNKYCYSAPFKQLVNDFSITGASVLSGIYLNGNPITIGQSGLTAINHYQGAVYFNSPLPANSILSGNYSFKDFNIELSDQQEYKLLFETQYVSNNTLAQSLSGLPLDAKVCPSIFIRTKNDENKPFALGGLEDRTKKIRAIVVADNEFQRTAVCNILKNMAYSPFYLINSTPFDAMGNMTGINYNFDNLSFDTGYFPWIMGVSVTDAPRIGNYKDMDKSMSIVDFNLSLIVKHA